MRRLTSIVLASAISMSSAFAADNAPLAAGKPAGVKEATLAGNGLLIFFGIAVVAGGIALVASQGSSGGTIAVTTTATAP